MKLKKKSAMILSFALGTALFASTAIAQVVTKSGYDELKNSFKYTAASCSGKLSSYTVETSFSAKDNGQVLNSENSITKYNNQDQTNESVNNNFNGKDKYSYYSYNDKEMSIRKDANSEKYFVTKHAKLTEIKNFEDPFKEDRASDVETIIDALVGNLKDAVVVTENSDGGKQLTGSLSESQVPTIANAVVSLMTKDQVNSRSNDETTRIKSDVAVKNVKGEMKTDKDGLLQNIVVTAEVTGKDAKGESHNISFEVSGRLYNVNSTTVAKPDLTGKKVETYVEKSNNIFDAPEKYVGSYKSDLIIEKNNKFEKIGERYVVVESIGNNVLSGKYFEKYKAGYEEYAKDSKEFSFNAQAKNDPYNMPYEAKAGDKVYTGSISVSFGQASLYFNLDDRRSSDVIIDGNFERVFE